MITELELRLNGAPSPDGEIRLRDLAAITAALQEMSLRIGRDSIDAAGPGRTKQFMEELTELRLRSVTTGSTRLVLSKGPVDKLNVTLREHQLVDDRFWDLINAVSEDQRPEWVTDLIAESVSKFVSALRSAAPQMVVSTVDRSQVVIRAEEIRSETWVGRRTQMTRVLTAAGRLEKVDLHSHEFRVRDDAGNAVELKHVADDHAAARLVGTWVVARGPGVLDRSGRLISIEAATVEAAEDPASGYTVRAPVSLASILASAPGPDAAGAVDLNDDEFATFLAAAR